MRHEDAKVYIAAALIARDGPPATGRAEEFFMATVERLANLVCEAKSTHVPTPQPTSGRPRS